MFYCMAYLFILKKNRYVGGIDETCEKILFFNTVSSSSSDLLLLVFII